MAFERENIRTVLLMSVWACFVFVAVHAYTALAQKNEQGAASAEPMNLLEPSAAGEAGLNEPEDVNPSEIPSLLFTYWEQTAIRDARRSRGLVRKPTSEELQRDLNKKPEGLPRIKPPPEERDIALGGIVYVSRNDWTIWLNGKRITPEALPEEVIDLSVYNEYIELKWFDYYSNQIFPIRLRPHQRFNIDTRIFLPG